MTVLTIRLIPDDVLRQVCRPVDVFGVDLAALADDMLETMYAAPGRGLAAPQVGITQRLFVMDAYWKTGDPNPQIFVNPVIVERSDAMLTQPEGCLSIPGDLTDVTRPDAVTVEWQDVTGAPHRGTFDGFAAACIQHEADHLDGILITDPERAA
ncbi:peptide deformylase [Yoonia sp. 208BN28-4]|uniref:peptide deformylase n=1 Tax=Yoonia sp. 208BN28-4 TaxID=3126505 RepID=UPI0030B756C2